MSIDCLHAFACRYFKYAGIWLPLTWVITRPLFKQDLRFVGFVAVYIGIKFTHKGINMHRHTRCKGVEVSNTPSGRVCVPPASRVG